MRTKAEQSKSPVPEAPPPGIRITSGRTKDEIGRIHHTDGAWHAYARNEEGVYRPLGAHADFAGALAVLPDAPAPTLTVVPAKPKAVAAGGKKAASPLPPPAPVQSGKPKTVRSKAA